MQDNTTTAEERKLGWRHYDITCKCGHSQRVKVFAPDHDDALSEAKENDCGNCDRTNTGVIEIDGGEVHSQKPKQARGEFRGQD